MPFNGKDLKTYDAGIQQYGVFFGSFPWQFFCTGTFATRHSCEAAQRSFTKFVNCLRDRMKHCPVEFIAVPERTTSGVGKPPGAWHWHFVMCGPDHRLAELANLIDELWSKHCGNVNVRPYDRSRAGAFYLAKTARSVDFDYKVSALNRVSSSCPDDLLHQLQSCPYVPPHLRDRLHGQTLVCRSGENTLNSLEKSGGE